MRIHCLGVGGTLMGGLALLARELGHRVSGSDLNIYPPMSDLLRAAELDIRTGYLAEHLQPHPDLVILGNAGLARGNPAVEYLLEQRLPFHSGASWLGREVLQHRLPLAVAGTHGKTTTTAMLAWILEHAGLAPGFLIAGAPLNFPHPARLGDGDCFVVEADEYDTSFFDRRAKFLHYHPRTLVINNLEYDHADIYADLAALEEQFHLLLRTLPGEGRLIRPLREPNLDRVQARGFWSGVCHTSLDGDAEFSVAKLAGSGRNFTLLHEGRQVGKVSWRLLGRHNVGNALAAVAAAHQAGVPPRVAAEALNGFLGVKRRLELILDSPGVKIHDDFAHHPTAIAATLQALRTDCPDAQLVALIEPGSHTMASGVHLDSFARATRDADRVLWFRTPKLKWNPELLANERVSVHDDPEDLVSTCKQLVQAAAGGPDTHLVMMSNGSFAGLGARLQAAFGQSADQVH